MAYLILSDVIWGYPCGLVDLFMREDAASNYQLFEGAQVCKPFSILIHLSQSMNAHNVFIACVVGSYFGIKVTNENNDVFCSLSVQH